ncbi:MAG TPA: carcinine hydrolase/isopenicillin-N N-acyltransferase family protein [Spirochaetia bacterium]|nr:carcinine hydrolase/isopenicillin-N N-acyltransferase family protein [Spirochaetia bacterium]
MPLTGSIAERLARIQNAFSIDGFTVRQVPAAYVSGAERGQPIGYLLKDGHIGVAAEQKSVRNFKTGRAKRAYYLEGSPGVMGWLLGALAEEDVSRMTNEYVQNAAFAFIDSAAASRGGVLAPLKELVVRLIAEASHVMLPDIPPAYIEEIDGIVEGCRSANPWTQVRRESLLALNLGFDYLLAHIYSGKLFAARGYGAGLLKTPLGCNAFSLSGAAAGGRHFFGRDFMFPTANVLQDTACLIIYRPEAAAGQPPIAFVSQTAPGIVGSMVGVNARGLAMGVDMLPSRFCNPDRPGLNSLLLVRDCLQACGSAGEAVAHVTEAPRGVPWLYPVADAGGAAYVIEAGPRLPPGDEFPYSTYVPRYYRRRLPQKSYVEMVRSKYGTPAPDKGLMVRSRDYSYPQDFIDDWNEQLWRAFDRSVVRKLADALVDFIEGIADAFKRKTGNLWRMLGGEIEKFNQGAVWSASYFAERGFINPTWTDTNCPGPFYFAPQRESRPDVLVATNHCITPEMRLAGMNEWTAILVSGTLNDFQWRYDELTREILDALDAAPSGIDEQAAWKLIDFLSPNGKFPDYYNPDRTRDWREVQVHGSVSLCELTGRTLTSRFGYYGDEPVTIHLGAFVT